MIPLSILDQVSIAKEQKPGETLKNTIELAQIAESLGYKRYWISEHHNNKHTAHSSPEILMASIANNTKNIMVGSGGIMLQHYSPYKVAENIKLLNALFPHRIDVGFGRAPGGDDIAIKALNSNYYNSNYHQKIIQVKEFLENEHIIVDDKELITSPVIPSDSEIWILGSSETSAKIAGKENLNFAFGHFLSPDDNGKSTKVYLESFKSNDKLKPKIALCLGIICAETIEKSEEIASSLDLFTVLLNRDLNPSGIPSPDEAKGENYNEKEKQAIADFRKGLIVGDPKKVKKEINRLAKIYQADEIIIVSTTFYQEDRIKSYQLIMKEMNE